MANPRYSPIRISGVVSSVARIGSQCVRSIEFDEAGHGKPDSTISSDGSIH